MNSCVSVLIIDDDSALTEAVEGMLQPAGYTTTVARNGFQALRLAREIRPSVILCDLNMPQMAGSDVLRELTTDPMTAAIPTVLMTGNIDADRSCAQGFLLKPFQAQDILTVLERIQDQPRPASEISDSDRFAPERPPRRQHRTVQPSPAVV